MAITTIKDQNGAALVEFAIALPLLILLLFGIVEFGLLLYNKHILTNACRAGARAGIVVRNPRLPNSDPGVCPPLPAPCSIEAVIDEWENQLITFGNKTFDAPIISPANPADRDAFGIDLTVTISFDYDFLVLSALGFDQVTLEAVSTMNME